MKPLYSLPLSYLWACLCQATLPLPGVQGTSSCLATKEQVLSACASRETKSLLALLREKRTWIHEKNDHAESLPHVLLKHGQRQALKAILQAQASALDLQSVGLMGKRFLPVPMRALIQRSWPISFIYGIGFS